MVGQAVANSPSRDFPPGAMASDAGSGLYGRFGEFHYFLSLKLLELLKINRCI